MPERLRRGIEVAENCLLAVFLSAMLGVAVYQIVARNAFGAGVVWGEEFVQMAVLWLTMVGGAVASGTDSHIRIDIVSRFGGPELRAVAARTTALFTACVCAALGWFSIEFIKWDFIDGTPGVGAVPAWVCETIIPAAAAVMALRYLRHAIWPRPREEQ
ncbi:MAG: TRAP transporter small permease [Gammaproteobacteria bacterium]|nr:TRAP transporter small permease [Gammaproteobacteria bacterium]